jgi:hypothetical protein
MVKIEAVMTQLLFEHALRIRLKAEVSKEIPETVYTASPNPEAADQANAETENDAENTSTVISQGLNGEGSSSAQSEEATLHSSSTSINSASSKREKADMKGKKAEEVQAKSVDDEKGKGKKDSKNLVGKINNLVTSDLKTIGETSDVLRICIMAPFQTALCIWFLYVILGWRYDLTCLHLISSYLLPRLSQQCIHWISNDVGFNASPNVTGQIPSKDPVRGDEEEGCQNSSRNRE